MRRWIALIGMLAVVIPALEADAAKSAVPLSVRKVVLYKNGMGYFEHLGAVQGKQDVEIVLPSTQLNDVLKSLTVIDLGNGQVAGVTYDSTAPLSRRLAELPIKLGPNQGLVSFLNQIRGTEVEIRAPGGVVAGKMMGAEVRRKQVDSTSVVEAIEVAVFTPQGEVRTVELASAEAVKIMERELASDVGRYLDLLDSAHQRDVRRLRIHTVGSGNRQLYVSYTSESPIWKTTYRIVLDGKQKPLLQGWAIVDNTTPMDWVDVDLSLVAGAPVSFVQNLSQPLYARRPVIPMPQGVQVTPQTHEATLEVPAGQAAVAGIVRDANGNPVSGATVRVLGRDGAVLQQGRTDGSGRFQIAGLAAGTYSVQAYHPSLGQAGYRQITVHSGRVTALNFSLGGVFEEGLVAGEKSRDELHAYRKRAAKAMPSAPGPALEAEAPAESIAGRLGDVMRQQASQTARAQALGEQFEYRLRQPVTIRQNQSALLPIIHTEVEGEKVSLYNEKSGERRPRLAVWLKNSSGLTLDAGSFAVIDSNAFAGEGVTETINPKEARLLSYALDLGLEVTTNRGTERQRVERVEIHRGVMRLHTKVKEKKSYVIRNNDEKVRTVVVEHPVRTGWSLVETPPATESTASYHRFRVEAKPKTTTEFVVREENPRQTTYAIRNVTPEQIALWVRQKTIDGKIERALKRIVAKKNEINDLNKKIAALEKDEKEIFSDQQRVRENLRRLGRTPEEAKLRQRYIRQLERQEDRLGTLRVERARLADARAAAQKHLDGMLEKMSFDRQV
ncbi:MAG: carboxypeptidase regulatory-like domain-containing protein [Candidatus Methylomirabilales bacterium]